MMVKQYYWWFFDDTKRNDYQKVPFWVIYLWWVTLFKNNVKLPYKTELLIFVTPRIVNDSVSRNH